MASDVEVCDLLRRDVTLRNTSMLAAGFSDTSHAAHVRSLLQVGGRAGGWAGGWVGWRVGGWVANARPN